MIAAFALLAALTLPDAPPALRLTALIRAYNAGDDATLIAFAREHYGPKVAQSRAQQESIAAYWRSVYREYGPVEMHSIRTSSRWELEVWARGTISRAWISFDLTVDPAPPHWVVAGGVGRGTKPDDAPPGERIDLDAYLHDLEEHELFSGSVLLIVDGKSVFERACGLANREHAVRNHTDTRFDIASVGKLFTAVAIAQLAEGGKISYSNSIASYLPEYPKPIADTVTIHHLLNHTSGIELDDDPEYVDEASRATTVAERLRIHLKHLPKLKWALPKELDYTNEGYDLLGAIIERTSGTTYDAFVRDNILVPAGMVDTLPFSIEQLPARSATGYSSRNYAGRYLLGPPHNNLLWLGRASTPAGGQFSTAADLARFAIALLDGRLLRRETLAMMLEKKYGFEVTARRFGHSGGLPGGSARLDISRDGKRVLVVLSNSSWVANNVADVIGDSLD